MPDPQRFDVPNAVERQSGIYTAALRDENGAPLGSAAISSFTLTLYDVNTGVTVNGRYQQNILNANQVTVDAQGQVTWTWLPLDMQILNPNRQQEEHVALFVVKWTDGQSRPRQANHEVHFTVNRIPRVN